VRPTVQRAAALSANLGRVSANPASRWDLLTICLVCVVLQYVWRVQEVLTPLAYVQFTSLVSLGAIVLFFLNRRGESVSAALHHELVLPMVVILVLAALSVPMSLHTRVSFEYFSKNFVKTVILVVVLGASVRDRADIDRLVRAMVIGGAGYIAISLLLASPAMGRLGGNGGRGSYDPNDLGLVTVGTVPLCVYMMRRTARPIDKIIGFGSAGLLIIATVKTGSRGGLLALLTVALYCLVGLKAVRQSTRVTTFVLGCVLMLAFGGSSYRERIGTLADPTEDYNWSGQAEGGRMEIWKRGLGYMAEHPLLGVGLNAFFVAEGTSEEAMRRRQEHAGFKWSAAHNSYIQIGAELGVLALVFFLRMLWLALRESHRLARHATREDDRMLAQCFVALLLSYIVGGAFLSQAYSTFLYFSLGILIGFSRIVRQSVDPARMTATPAHAASAISYVRPSRRRPEGWIRVSNS